MDRVRLLPMQLPPASSLNNGHGSPKGKVSFVKRLALGFIILAGLGLLYVPAYHSAQGQFAGLVETPSPVGSVGRTHSIASVGKLIRKLDVFYNSETNDNLNIVDGQSQLRGWSYNTSRDARTYIHPEKTTTILNPRNICSDSPYLLIIVCSAVDNTNARVAIRNTWGNQSNLDTQFDSSVRMAFLLGQSDNDTLNGFVADENHLYNDIIQENFHDTYNNLTLKSSMLLKWVTTNCDKLSYLMKTDDDMFINVPALVKALKGRRKSTETLIGSLIWNARPITDPKNKWYTPRYMYAERTYPNYLSGTGYVMSFDVAERLYKAVLSTPLLHLEDVYITGICAKRAGLKPMNHYGFSYMQRKIESCVIRESITTHKVNVSSMYTIWSKLQEPTTGC